MIAFIHSTELGRMFAEGNVQFIKDQPFTKEDHPRMIVVNDMLPEAGIHEKPTPQAAISFYMTHMRSRYSEIVAALQK